jgi:Rrf2 family protein
MLSHKAKYGLKALLSIAANSQLQPTVAAELSKREGIPRKFLEQILLELKRRGLLQSRRGPGGGYLLARPPEKLSVLEIIRALDGPLAPVPCVSLSAPAKCCDDCVDESTCGIHIVMDEAHTATVRILGSTMLADVVRSVAAAEALRRAEQRAVAGGEPARIDRNSRAVPFHRSQRKPA